MIRNREVSAIDDQMKDAVPGDRPYISLVKMVEDLFVQHGDNHRGLGYPKAEGFDTRYRVYLDVTRFGPSAGLPCTMLDVGCGTGRLLDEIKAFGSHRNYLLGH